MIGPDSDREVGGAAVPRPPDRYTAATNDAVRHEKFTSCYSWKKIRDEKYEI